MDWYHRITTNLPPPRGLATFKLVKINELMQLVLLQITDISTIINNVNIDLRIYWYQNKYYIAIVEIRPFLSGNPITSSIYADSNVDSFWVLPKHATRPRKRTLIPYGYINKLISSRIDRDDEHIVSDSEDEINKELAQLYEQAQVLSQKLEDLIQELTPK